MVERVCSISAINESVKVRILNTKGARPRLVARNKLIALIYTFYYVF